MEYRFRVQLVLGLQNKYFGNYEPKTVTYLNFFSCVVGVNDFEDLTNYTLSLVITQFCYEKCRLMLIFV